MADTKITALTAITTVDPAADVLPIVDVSDTSMAASGTTKKITSNQILGAGGTATLASATITGDLTVATDRLKVNTGSTAVQIGSTTQTQIGTTAWPSDLISKANSRVLIGNLGTTLLWNESSPAIGNASTLYIGAKTGAGATTFGGGYISAGTENASDRAGFFALSTFQSNGIDRERYRIDSTGVHTWQYVGGVAGTAMTLNSTGLGVGVSPAVKLDIGGAATQQFRIQMSGQADTRVISDTGTGIIGTYSNHQLIIRTNSTNAVVVDASQNVGIGVTPSAWAAGYTAIQNRQTAWWSSASRDFHIGANVYYNGTNEIYIGTAQASKYTQYQAAHYWYNAPSGTAGNAITFTQAMTLDASGRLITNSSTFTPPTLNTNGELNFIATSNTNVRFSYRGTDGVTRVANITLA